ncbi:hypothetical protein [Streptomyces sp. NPDC000410]|uniref:hypothetical protein n=1 Tax=Streptomyces sp. NPDC000410 TaxID=3154254 RepID=UPI0033175CFC
MRKNSLTWRAAAAATAVVALALGLTACGGDDPKSNESSNGQSQSPTDKGKGSNATPQESESVIATIQGPESVTLDITAVERDSGGFLTVKGVLKNSGTQSYSRTSVWSGPEVEIIRGAGGSSLGGATLVDKGEKKRYYILRDTENRPLASTGIGTLKANTQTPVFMQFPAPPASTTEVDFLLPTFAATTLKLAGE